MIIYKAINLINNKVYIGQTNNSLEYRKNQHHREARSELKKKRKNNYFHNAINKYKFESFEFIEIDKAETQESLDTKEIFWINFYNSTNKEIGYNLDSGGRGGGKKSLETKRKIGMTTKAKWKDPETAKKMLDGLRKGTETVKNKPQKLVEFICPNCNKKLMLLPYEAKDKKFCSLRCAGLVSGLKGIGIAAEQNHSRNIENKKDIAKFILNWSQDNRDIIISCPYNKITTYLNPLLNEIDNKYNIKDFRSLFICFNVNNKKEFLTYLKDYIVKENIC